MQGPKNGGSLVSTLIFSSSHHRNTCVRVCTCMRVYVCPYVHACVYVRRLSVYFSSISRHVGHQRSLCACAALSVGLEWGAEKLIVSCYAMLACFFK